MKKFIKVFLLSLLIIIVCTGIFFRHKISLCINLGKKYIDIKNNDGDFKASINMEALNSMDYKDVVYKVRNGKELTLDIYGPKKEVFKKSPVILYVHGGSWLYGDKTIPGAISPVLESFRDSGYTIISTSYELLNKDIDFGDQVSDIKDTLKWINKYSNEYNLDSNEIGIIGTSSGAHLTLLAAYSNEDEFVGDKNLKEYPIKINYIIDLFGPTDLNSLDLNNVTWDMEQILKNIPNYRDIAKKYSPLYYVKENAPNLLIIHSKDDVLVPYENATKLYEENKLKGNKVSLITLENSSHDLSYIDATDAKNFVVGILKFILLNTP